MEFKQYSNDKETALLKLDNIITQGKHVKLRIIKPTFLSRSTVFKSYHAFYAENNNEVVGSGVLSRINIKLNNQLKEVSFTLDGKVHPGYRKQGIGKTLSDLLVKRAEDLYGNKDTFTTLKSANTAIIKLIIRQANDKFLYPFTYLMIPSYKVIPNCNQSKEDHHFSVELFDKNDLDESFYHQTESGAGFFRTKKMYTLEIVSISKLISLSLKLLQLVSPKRFKDLPKVGVPFSTSTAYGLLPANISSINELLRQNLSEGTDYLMVCCQRGDAIYKLLKRHSVNETNYFIGANFSLSENQKLSIDVRCC